MSFKFFNPISPQQSVATPPIVAQSAPPTTGPQALQYSLGTIWVDTATNVVYVLTSISGGTATWVNTIPASGGTFTDLTVNPGPTAITGQFRVNGNVNEANVIQLEENGGASGTISILSAQGTGANSVNIVSTAGGIEMETSSAAGNIVISSNGGGTVQIGSTGDTGSNDLLLNVNGGTASNLLIENQLGTGSGSVSASAVGISAPAGAVYVSSADNISGAIVLDASTGGTSSGILLTAQKSVSIQASGANVGEVTLTADDADATAISLNASNAAGGIDFQAGTGGFDVDTTGAIALDSLLASNFTVTGAAADLTLSSAGGSVNVTATEAVADAIFLNASAGGIETVAAGVIVIQSTDTTGSDIVIEANAAGGGVLIEATGTSGAVTIAPAVSLLMGDTATVTTIDLGNITPTVNRTTSISGGAVIAAHTDTLNLATGGVNTNASATKVVNIATGANLLGTQTVNISTGTAASGTKAINVGNIDGLSIYTGYGVYNINTSTCPAATTIGNVSAGGAVGINSSTTITSTAAGVNTLTSTDTTGSDVVISATGAGGGIKIAPTATTNNVGIGNVVPTVARTITISGGTVATAVTDTLNLGTGGVSSNASATKIVNIASDLISTGVSTVNISTGTATTGTKSVNIGNADGKTAVLVSGGNVSIANAQVAGAAGPSATVAVTNQARVGSVTLSGYTQAATATLTITLTNALIAAGSMIFASMTDVSSNSTLMTLEKINPGSGSAVFVFVNNGSQAVNGNLQFNYWILS